MREPTTETGGDGGVSFSVITRTLGSSWLADALESLARQTRMDFELVLVDMSGGQAESILARFTNHLPAVRRLVVGTPVSRPRALNAGIAAASGFDLEYRSARRCMAGLYWKHRHLFRGERRRELKLAAAEHCRRRMPARQRFLARTAGEWRLELGLDLISWWLGRASGRARRSAA